MLEDYYELRGWDRATGIPAREHLKALGLEDVAEDMGKCF
jgi:aldehyde:ferredoxin oxidoreductase